MKKRYLSGLTLSLVFLMNVTVAAPTSAYLGQEGRDIKALSGEDVHAYLNGKGMGLARAAELNHYPGPAHVLELAVELALTPEQRVRTEALFVTMTSKAIALGQALVDEERALDRLFASKTISQMQLDSALGKIGALQAQVRGIHLAAHLTQVEILSAQQRTRYDQLRGYANAAQSSEHGQQQHGVH